MSSSIHILCPGQGAQSIGMAKDFHEKSPLVRDIFATANQVLGFDLASLCFTGPEDQLNQTNISQPAIFVTSIAAYRAALDSKIIHPTTITTYAGLSLGEYTALHLAGVFSFEEGLKLVQKRGHYMQQAATATPSGMVAILGADAAAVAQLCNEAAQGEVLVPANYNAPGQIVVSGATSACDRVLKLSETAGFKSTALKVAGAFHSPLMQPAADRMAAELENVTFNHPNTTVYSNVTAQPHTDPATIKRLLIDQIVKPVKWEQTMQTLIGQGDARFIELAPGRTLAGLAKRINRRLPIESLSTAEALTTGS